MSTRSDSNQSPASGNTDARAQPATQSPTEDAKVTRLPVRSPWSVAPDDDRYSIHWLGDSQFRQYDSGVYGVEHREEEGADGSKKVKDRPYPILPGRLSVERTVDLADVQRDGTPGDLLDTSFHVTYAPPKARTITAVISSQDTRERQPIWPDVTSIGTRVSSKKLDQVVNAVKAMSLTAERDGLREEGYAATGLLYRDGCAPAFLRQGQPALLPHGVDTQAIAELESMVGTLPGVGVLALDDPSGPEQFGDDLLALLRLTDLLPDQPYIPVALLGQLMWAPWSSDDSLGRAPVVLKGDSGLRKTAMAGLIIAAQSRTYGGGGEGQEVPVTVNARDMASSRIGTDRVLYPLRGMVALVDDLFAGRMAGKEAHQAWKYLSSVANNSVLGSGGAKGTKSALGIKADRYPRGCPLATAEELPDEDQHASEVNRTAALDLRTAVRLDVLTELQGDPRALSRAHAGMVQRGLRDLDAPKRALAEATQQVQGWNVTGHARAGAAYSKLLAGLLLYGDHLRDACEIDPKPLITEWSDALACALDEQAHRCGMSSGRQDARDHTMLFVRHLTALLGESADLYAAHATKTVPMPSAFNDGDGVPRHQPPEVPGYSPGVLGWRQGGNGWAPAVAGEPIGAVHVDAGKGRPAWRPITLRIKPRVFSAVYERIKARVAAVQGWPMPSEDTMRRKLAEAGFLRSTVAGKEQLWTGEGTTKVLMLDLGKTLDIEPPESEDGGGRDGDGGSPVDGGPTELQPEPEPEPDPQPELDLEERGRRGDGRYGTCAACGHEMVILRAGQTLHPMCEPEPDLARYDFSDQHCQHRLDNPVDSDDSNDSGAAVDTGTDVQGPCLPADSPSGSVDVATVAEETPQECGETTRRGLGALDLDGLHVPNGNPVLVDLDSIIGLSDLYVLAEKHGLGQLWVHPQVTAAWGLPAFADRPPDLRKDAGMPHPFAQVPDGMHVDPGGLAPWNVVWRGEVRKGSSRSVVLPSMEERMPWRDIPDGATLIDAVQRLNGALKRDYYWSPGDTLKKLIRGHTKTLKPNLAVQRGEVPPCAVIRDGRNVPTAVYRQMIKGKWIRGLSDHEDAAIYVHQVDLSAAELAGFNAKLPTGDPPEHWTEPFVWDHLSMRYMSGYVRLGSVPVGDAMLPEFRCRATESGVWVTVEDVKLLAGLGILPELLEGYVWPKPVRCLYSSYDVYRKARADLWPQRGEPGGYWAAKASKPLYTRALGILARTDGPSSETDEFWRPDIRDMIQAQTYANMYRQLANVGKRSGQYPFAMSADSVWFVAYDYEPEKAIPEPLTLGFTGGQWQHEGCVPLAAVRDQIEPDSNSFFRAFRRELDRKA